MKNVVVVDSGWGGDLFSNLIKQELDIINLTRAIDYDADYAHGLPMDICLSVAEAVKPHLDTADIIILASYEATITTIDYLRQKYPHKTFLGFEPQMADLLPSNTERASECTALIASTIVQNSVGYKIEKERLAATHHIIEINCDQWITWADADDLDCGKILDDLKRQNIQTKTPIDTALIYSTALADAKSILEDVFGWQLLSITDLNRTFWHLCKALGLKHSTGKFR